MMTIKEFAALCGCNTQTLRYYDRIDLLKPTKVDQWSGYRYYERTQALDYVKIKNLQSADFTIGEIKVLLTKGDPEVYDAFTQKVRAQEQKLERIRQIQQSYLTEKNTMENIIQDMSDFLLRELARFELLPEFGFRTEDGPEVVERIRAYFNAQMRDALPDSEKVTLVVNDEVYHGADRAAEAICQLDRENLYETILLGDDELSEGDFFDPAEYEPVWELHGWGHIYEFLDDIPELDADREHILCLRLNTPDYCKDAAFSLFMIGAMLLRKREVGTHMGCTVEKSTDGQNHFVLMRKK